MTAAQWSAVAAGGPGRVGCGDWCVAGWLLALAVLAVAVAAVLVPHRAGSKGSAGRGR